MPVKKIVPMERIVKLETVTDDYIKSEQDRRIKRRIGALRTIVQSSEDEGFARRTEYLMNMYEKFLKNGTGISHLADATFVQGLIRNLDHEVGNYWAEKLKEIKGGSDDPNLEELVDVLPKAFPHLAAKAGLAEEIDSLIRECKDPSALYDSINAKIGAKKHGSIETLLEDYEQRRQSQIEKAPNGFYPKFMKGLDQLFEGQIVTPSAEGVGRDVEYQLKRLERRLREFGKTYFIHDPALKDFMEKFGGVIGRIKAGKCGSRFGNAFMAQAMNIYVSTLAKNWMERKIDALDISGAEEAVMDLRNIPETLSHLARTPGLVSEIEKNIRSALVELGTRSRMKEKEGDEKRRKRDVVIGLRDRINEILTGEEYGRYMSHSGEEESRGFLSTQYYSYVKELLERDKDMDREYVKNVAGEALKKAADKESLKKELHEIVNNDEHGLAEAEAITRRIMSSGKIENMGPKARRELEGHIGALFREREAYIRNLNKLLVRLVEAWRGKRGPEKLKPGKYELLELNQVISNPEVKKTASEILNIPVQDVDEQIGRLYKYAEKGLLQYLLDLFTNQRKALTHQEITEDEGIRRRVAKMKGIEKEGKERGVISDKYLKSLYTNAHNAFNALEALEEFYEYKSKGLPGIGQETFWEKAQRLSDYFYSGPFRALVMPVIRRKGKRIAPRT